ncbi:hypothetical protein GCM10027021_30380 [Dyella kyungheensis]|jgi:hypothetical protein
MRSFTTGGGAMGAGGGVGLVPPKQAHSARLASKGSTGRIAQENEELRVDVMSMGAGGSKRNGQPTDPSAGW